MKLLEHVQAILDEYPAYLPLTLRQIFYRLVGAYDYPKTEAAYERLASILIEHAGLELFGWGAIRDDGGAREGGPGGQAQRHSSILCEAKPRASGWIAQ